MPTTKTKSTPKSAQAPDTVPYIELEPYQRFYAFWRRESALPKPNQRRFDLLEAEKLLQSMRVAGADFGRPQIDATFDPLRWSREESLFWLQAFCLKNQIMKRLYEEKVDIAAVPPLVNSELAQKLPELDLAAVPTAEVLCALVVDSFKPKYREPVVEPPLPVTYALLNLLPLPIFFEFWQKSYLRRLDNEVLDALRRYVLPYLSDDEISQANTYLQLSIDQKQWQASAQDNILPPHLIAAAALSMHQPIAHILENSPQEFWDSLTGIRGCGKSLVFGLSDTALIRHYFKSHNLLLNSYEDRLSWLAHTGLDDVSGLVEHSSFHNDASWETLIAKDILNVLHLVHDVSVVPILVHYAGKKAMQKEVRKWINNNPVFAFIGLAEIKNPHGDDKTFVERNLLDLATVVEAAHLPPHLVPKLNQLQSLRALCDGGETTLASGQDDAQAVPPQIKKIFDDYPIAGKVNLPKWLQNAALKPVVIDGYALSPAQRDQVLRALKLSKFQDVHPLIVEIGALADKGNYDHFVWDLFERWLSEGTEMKEKWCMQAVGMLGSDDIVGRLVPMMKEWRQSNLTVRAVAALECLTLSGSDQSLAHLHAISQTVSLKSLRSRALLEMSNIARAKGLTPEQLADRIVPRLGLDATGHRVFDMGGRKFDFVFGADLKPYLKDADGKMRTDLPAANQQDDIIVAAAALADWKVFKKTFKSIIKAQCIRFELAMVSGRRWSVDEFQSLFVEHPLLKNLVKLIVWAQFDDAGKYVLSFRLNDEGEYVDQQDKKIALDQKFAIVVLHPILSDETCLADWGQMLADYNLAAPFVQLGRPIFRLNLDEIDAGSVKRFDGLEVEAVYVPSILDRLYWESGLPGDGGCIYNHTKYFPGRSITAVIEYTGIYVGDLKGSEPQKLESLYFKYGQFVGEDFFVHNPTSEVKLNALDSVMVSEILHDLTLLFSKAK